MAVKKGELLLYRAVPGGLTARALIQKFFKDGEGLVSAFSDSRARALQEFCEEEVQAFGALVAKQYRLCGAPSRRIVQSQSYMAAIALSCESGISNAPMNNLRGEPGLHEAIGRTLKELIEWGVDPGAADFVLASDHPLKSRLAALREISERTESRLEAMNFSTVSAMAAVCLNEIPERDLLDERWLIFIGSEVSPIKLKWLRWASETGIEVTCVMDGHAQNGQVFEDATKIEKILGAAAIPIGSGNRLLQNLFASEQVEGGATIPVQIQSAPDPMIEMEWALRTLNQYNNLDASAIYVPDMESYAPLAEMASDWLGIPVRVKRRSALLSNGFARFVSEFLQALVQKETLALSRTLKNTYLNRDPEASRLLISWATREPGQRNVGDDLWAKIAQGMETDEEQSGWFKPFYEWRVLVLPQFLRIGQWFEHLHTFTEIVKEYVPKGDFDGYHDKRDSNALSALLRSVKLRASLNNEDEAPTCSIFEFISWCHSIWQREDVSVPSAESGIVVTSDPDALLEVKHLAILGMLEGIFPRRRREDAILPDSVRNFLSQNLAVDVPLAVSKDQARLQRDTFYRLVASATETLLMSYPLANEGSDNVPAFYLSEVEGATPVTVISYGRRQTFGDEPTIWRDSQIQELLAKPRAELRPVLVQEPLAKAMIPTPENISIKGVADFDRCPFIYFTKESLGLRPPSERSHWYKILSLPERIQLFAQPERDAAAWLMQTALDEEIEKIEFVALEWELEVLKTGGKRAIEALVEGEFAAREKWPKLPDSIKTEDRGNFDALSRVAGLRFSDRIPATSEMENRKIAHIYQSKKVSAPGKWMRWEKLEYWLWLLAMYDHKRNAGIQIQSLNGETFLLLFKGLEDSILDGDASRTFSFVKRGEDADEILKSVKERLRDIGKAIVAFEAEPLPGSNCTNCNFGDLCRRSFLYGEQRGTQIVARATEDL